MRGIRLMVVSVALVVSVGVAVLVSQMVSGGGTDRRHELGTATRAGGLPTVEVSRGAGSALATPGRSASPRPVGGTPTSIGSPVPTVGGS